MSTVLDLMNGSKEIGDNIVSRSDAICGVIKRFWAEIDDRPLLVARLCLMTQAVLMSAQ